MSAQSFKVAINKEDFDIINQNSEIETYEVDGVSRIRCYSCRGKWVNCFAAKINEFEKTNYKMLGELNI
jgi:hypothetical protein